MQGSYCLTVEQYRAWLEANLIRRNKTLQRKPAQDKIGTGNLYEAYDQGISCSWCKEGQMCIT